MPQHEDMSSRRRHNDRAMDDLGAAIFVGLAILLAAAVLAGGFVWFLWG